MYRPSSPASHSAEHLLPFTSDRSSEENSTQPVTTANVHDEVTASFSFSYWRRSDHTTSTRLRFPTLTSRRIVPFFLLVSCGFILPLLINIEFLPTTFTIRGLYPKGARPRTPFASGPWISRIRDGALPVEASLETRLELLKRVPLVERDDWIALNEQVKRSPLFTAAHPFSQRRPKTLPPTDMLPSLLKPKRRIPQKLPTLLGIPQLHNSPHHPKEHDRIPLQRVEFASGPTGAQRIRWR